MSIGLPKKSVQPTARARARSDGRECAETAKIGTCAKRGSERRP